MSPRHVLVTGASGGIGRAVTELLEPQGDKVTCFDLPDHDVTDRQAITEAIEKLDHETRIDALVHTAGTLCEGSALHPDPEAAHRALEVNLFGVMNVCSATARLMTQRGDGAIVVVSSNSAAVPRVGLASYGASKAAATSWTRALGLECAPHGVRCNIVSPGSTDTAMLRSMWDGEDRSEQVIAGTPEKFWIGIPDGTLGQPDDIAQACAFLISPAARHITMHDLRVDGGATLDN